MASGEIFFEHESWGRNLAWSAGLHAGFALAIVLYMWIAGSRSGSNWGAGGGGSAMEVRLINNVPLPANPVQTQSVLATESKGLSQSKPQEKVEEPTAVPIPEKNAKLKPKPPQPTATQRKPQPQPVEQADNQIPFGEGGPATAHYSMFNAGGANGGVAVGGGGDFSSRYAWYVRVITQKVSDNWLKTEVDPRIQSANRVYITFDIDRSGRPSHVQIEQSSNVPSLDTSAVRALQRIDTFGPLPSDYSGSHVSVEYWFDYKR